MLTIGLLRERNNHKEIAYILGAFFILTMGMFMISFTMAISLYNSTENLNPEKCTEPYNIARNYNIWIFPFCLIGMFVICSSFIIAPDYIYLLHGGVIINTMSSIWCIIVYCIVVSVRNDTTYECVVYWNKLDERVLFFLDFSYVGLVEGSLSTLVNSFICCYLYTHRND
jgi:hypothetical protein